MPVDILRIPELGAGQLPQRLRSQARVAPKGLADEIGNSARFSTGLFFLPRLHLYVGLYPASERE